MLISDNGTQFNYRDFKGLTKDLGIHYKFASVAHLQTNGQTEVTKRTILSGLKKRLNGAKAK